MELPLAICERNGGPYGESVCSNFRNWDAFLRVNTSPALALGGCGANMHRNGNGVCVAGGQNQGLLPAQDGPSGGASGERRISLQMIWRFG